MFSDQIFLREIVVKESTDKVGRGLHHSEEGREEGKKKGEEDQGKEEGKG